MQLRPDQKQAAITYLVTNCDCWKNKEKVLNSLDDETLIDVLKDVRNRQEDTVIANSVKSGIKIGNEIVKYDSEKKTIVKNACGSGDEEDPEIDEEDHRVPSELVNPKKKVAPSRTTTPTVEKVQNAMTSEQFDQLCINHFGQSAATIKSGMDILTQMEQTKRQNLVKRLVANVHDDERKKVLATNLLKKPISELETMVELLPPQQPTRNRQEPVNLNFLGIGGGPVSGGRVDNAADDTLELPTLNWRELECVSPAFQKKN